MAYVSGLLIGVPSTSRVQIEDVDYLLKVAKVIVETDILYNKQFGN